MPRESRVAFVTRGLRNLIDAQYLAGHINRAKLLQLRQILRRRASLRKVTAALYGSKRHFVIGDAAGEPTYKLHLLQLKKMGKGQFNLLVFERMDSREHKRQRRCLVGHRFTEEIAQSFRWNVRAIFELFGVEPQYVGFDGAAVSVIDDLLKRIKNDDFCYFDNRDTTEPSKPNVYIEAGMAMALNRPFIFSHFTRREVWPSDFSNILYVSYNSYQDLFEKLYSQLPIFLEKRFAKNRLTHRRLSSAPRGGRRHR